jgi:hypothetical protein
MLPGARESGLRCVQGQCRHLPLTRCSQRDIRRPRQCELGTRRSLRRTAALALTAPMPKKRCGLSSGNGAIGLREKRSQGSGKRDAFRWCIFALDEHGNTGRSQRAASYVLAVHAMGPHDQKTKIHLLI